MRSASRITRRGEHISELLIISINGLMHLFRTVKTAQGLMSLTLPGASPPREAAGFPLAAREPGSLPACLVSRSGRRQRHDNDLTPGLLPTCYTHARARDELPESEWSPRICRKNRSSDFSRRRSTTGPPPWRRRRSLSFN